jgi:pilus assembly protein TadC
VTSSGSLAIGCVALAALVGVGRPGWASSRLRVVLPRRGDGPPTLGGLVGRVPAEVRVWGIRAAGLVVAALLLTGRAQIAVPAALGAAVLAVPARREAARRARDAARLRRDLPRAADLLATCLDAGASPSDAVLLVCDVVDGPVRDALRPIGAALRSGIDPASAWAAVPGRTGVDPHQGPLDRLGRAFARAAATGAPLAETVAAVADEERERLRWGAETAARRVGVRVVGPLALCFLPAFVLLGVVPVVAGIAGEVLGGMA